MSEEQEEVGTRERISWSLRVSLIVHVLCGYSQQYAVTALNPTAVHIQAFINKTYVERYMTSTTTAINLESDNKSSLLSSMGDLNTTNYHEPELTIPDEYLRLIWASIGTANFLGQILAGLVLQPIADSIGRRDTTMIVKNVFLMTGCGLCFLSRVLGYYELLILGEFLAGAMVIFGKLIGVFLAESVPTSHRGSLSSVIGIGIRLWVILGVFAGLPQLGVTEANWHHIFLYPIIPSFIHLVCVLFTPRSPKFLYINRDDVEATKHSLRFYHGRKANLDKMLKEYEMEKQLSKANGNMKTGLMKILKSHYLRSTVGLCILTACTRPLSGTMIVNIFSTSILIDIGVTLNNAALYSALFTQLPSMLFALLLPFIVDRYGRRKMLFGGFGTAITGAICIIFAGVLSTYHVTTIATLLSVTGLLMIMCGASLGPAVIGLFLPGELCPQNVRAAASGWGLMLDNTFASLLVLSFPFLSIHLQSFAMLPMVTVAVALLTFLYFTLPETNGKTVQQTSQLWLKSNDLDAKTADL